MVTHTVTNAAFIAFVEATGYSTVAERLYAALRYLQIQPKCRSCNPTALATVPRSSAHSAAGADRSRLLAAGKPSSTMIPSPRHEDVMALLDRAIEHWRVRHRSASCGSRGFGMPNPIARCLAWFNDSAAPLHPLRAAGPSCASVAPGVAIKAVRCLSQKRSFLREPQISSDSVLKPAMQHPRTQSRNPRLDCNGVGRVLGDFRCWSAMPASRPICKPPMGRSMPSMPPGASGCSRN